MKDLLNIIDQLKSKVDQQGTPLRELDKNNRQLNSKIYSQGFETECPTNDNKQLSDNLKQQHTVIEWFSKVLRQEVLQPKRNQIGELGTNNWKLIDKIYSKRYQTAGFINDSKQLDDNLKHEHAKFEWFPNILKEASVEALQLQRTEMGRLIMDDCESKYKKDPQKFQTEWPINDNKFGDNQNQQQNQLEWYAELFNLANAFGLEPKQTQFAKLLKDDWKYKIYPQTIPTGGPINDNRQFDHNQNQEQTHIEILQQQNQLLIYKVQQLQEMLDKTVKGKSI
jgi:hypothetical protein